MAPELAVHNATALVGMGLDPLPRAVITIADGRIAAIDSGSVPQGLPLIDARGGFVIPGLIDWHVHLDLDPTGEPLDSWRRPPSVRGRTIALNALRALRAGITTVRDLGSPDLSVVEFRRSLPQAGTSPRILACGRMIMQTGGHAHEVGRAADGPDEVRRAVREQLRDGADVIKVMASGGFSTPGDADSAEYTLDELRAAADESHRGGRSIAAHAHSDVGIVAASEAGIDTIEHGGLIGREGIAALLETSALLIPTIRALTAPVGCAAARADLRESYAEALRCYKDSIRSAISAGVVIAAGTDAGTYFNPFGGLVDELAEYVALGMTTDAALRSATTVGNRIARVPIGQIALGFGADLVVVDRDPRDDLNVLRNPRAVISAGCQVDLGWIDNTLGRYQP